MTGLTGLGPRERDVLAVLRRADGSLTAREALHGVRSDGDDVTYTTVKRTVDRLVEKGLVDREPERVDGTTRHRYRFDAVAARDRLLPPLADEVRAVLGRGAAAELAREVRTDAPRDDRDDARRRTHDP